MLACDQCFLCGIQLDRETHRRYQAVDKMQALIQNRCIVTPLGYQLLQNLPASSRREPICIPCVNWKRRLESAANQRRKTYLQVSPIMFLLITLFLFHARYRWTR